MVHVKIVWVSFQEGGRKSVPPEGRYFSVARFPDDINWQNNAWSVVFELEAPEESIDETVSYGTVKFLVDNAPTEKMAEFSSFDIYEGPKKVAQVIILD
ncbi:hypothetical protein FEM41_16180 [Jejubacter calystegiae]|uniref:Uncharacterized protein n=1 Tax=Jejubacter calystegiae TaxID=2579935 RepID=A0A4P8YQT2_9ENTR|nr:hypothetical protein [Jejubacter calystegiae]QCT21072.1 hypothetical protein FEM41_16180 [Jejubacter calystegiae]